MGVYQINGPDRVYIGSSDDIPRRWKTHLSQLRGGRHHNYRLQEAWNLHGEAAFTFEIIEEVAHLDGLITAEQRHLNVALVNGPVYNLALDVTSPARGLTHTAEARLKMSAAIKASMTPRALAARSERMRGNANPAAKLTDALVVDICQRLMASGHPAEVAVEFGVTESLVYQIRRGQIWTHIVTPDTVATMMTIRQNGWANREITQEIRECFRAVGRANKGRLPSSATRAKLAQHSRGATNPNAKLTEVLVAHIKGLLDAGARCKDVGPAFGISANTVSRIKTGQPWQHVIAVPVSAQWAHLLHIPPREPATAEHRAKISAALKGKPKSAEHRANLWASRQVTSEFIEQMARNGAAAKGKPKSAETRAKISAAQAAGRRVLTTTEVGEIKRLLADGETRGSEIARRFAVTPGTISSIKHGRNWAHVPPNVNTESPPARGADRGRATYSDADGRDAG
jgi:GIY-YIG catalytic domain/NUMOD3 motif